MSVTLTGYAGYFVRQGAFIGEFNRVAAQYGSALTAGFQSIWIQFASSDQAAVQNLPAAVESYRGTAASYQSTLTSNGITAATLQVKDSQSVIPDNFVRVVQIVATQMRATNQTVQRPTLTTVVTPNGDNLGDATLAIGTTNQYGDQLDCVYAETITATCTSASTNFAETFGVVGESSVALTSTYWPAGSGASTSLSVTNPANTSLVTDGGFAQWTGNDPDQWNILDGAAGTTVLKGTGLGVRSGTDAAKIVSDGSQATQLGQPFNASVNTVYCIEAQAKGSASDGSGTFVMSLTDANGNILQDDAGNNLTYSRNMSAQVTTSYQTFTVFFATPRQLPSIVNVQYGFGVAPSAAKFILVDLVAVVTATQLYAQGPFAAMFAGTAANAIGDSYTVAVTNSLGSNSFVRGCQRVFNFPNLGNTVYYPSALSPSISDSLVTH